MQVPSGSLDQAMIDVTASVWLVDDALTELPTRRLSREDLPLEQEIPGPAVIYQQDTTIAVPPGWQATATDTGPMILSANRGGTA